MEKHKLLLPAALLCSLLLTGCNLENMDSDSSQAQTTAVTSTEPQAETQEPAESVSVPEEPLEPDDVIPAAIQSPRRDGSRLSYSIVNVFSDGEYYTVDISGVKLTSTADVPDIETTYVEGDLYGDFRLDLLKQGELIDTLKINVPRDDRFLIFESVTQELSYGCELISNMRDFGASEYPDLIQLDFHILNEAEVPQYARYFTVSGGKLCEVPIYENGAESAPYGTHLEPESAGVMIQRVVAKEYGEYTVKQFEYTFDPDSLIMTRRRVQYTGYN